MSRALSAEERYRAWKVNTGVLYDFLSIHALAWPSLTVQWLPGTQPVGGTDCARQKILLGTQTSASEPNQLLVAEIVIPDPRLLHRGTDYASVQPKFKFTRRFEHAGGDVDRARYCPGRPQLVATKSSGADVYLFDVGSLDEQDEPEEVRALEPAGHAARAGHGQVATLSGQVASGFGLAWCAQPTEPLLASTCAGGSIALWDARAVAVEGARHLAPRDVYASAHPTVNDVAWHAQGNQPLLLASVGNDNALRVWDTRLKPADAAVMAAHPHAAELNCVAFSPADENLLATGDADGHIFLHDLRQVGAAAANLHASGEQLLQLAWCPQRPRLVAAVDESRVLLVNLPDHTTQEGQPDMHAHGGGHHGGAVHHAATADADVRFAHAGQASSVYDVSWSDEQEGMLASVAPVALAGGTGGTGGGGGGGAGLPEGGAEAAGSEIHPNVLHVWQPARNVMAELGH